MPSNQTSNYALNQWSKDDRVLMDDFNADNAKIDAAIKAVDQKADGLAGSKADASALSALAQTAAGHTASIAKRGNCQIYTTTYVGTGLDGASNPNTLTFPQKPSLVIIGYDNSFMLHIFPCDAMISWNYSTVEFKWTGKTLSWFGPNPIHQLNVKDTTYYVIAFWPMDAN